MSEFDRKLEAARAEMTKAGIGASTQEPPLTRFSRQMGYKSVPPLYQGFLKTTLRMGSFFGLAWGVFMWLFIWKQNGMPVSVAVTGAIAAGVLFGVAMAGYYAYMRKKHGLTDWDAL